MAQESTIEQLRAENVGPPTRSSRTSELGFLCHGPWVWAWDSTSSAYEQDRGVVDFEPGYETEVLGCLAVGRGRRPLLLLTHFSKKEKRETRPGVCAEEEDTDSVRRASQLRKRKTY